MGTAAATFALLCVRVCAYNLLSRSTPERCDEELRRHHYALEWCKGHFVNQMVATQSSCGSAYFPLNYAKGGTLLGPSSFQPSMRTVVSQSLCSLSSMVAAETSCRSASFPSNYAKDGTLPRPSSFQPSMRTIVSQTLCRITSMVAAETSCRMLISLLWLPPRHLVELEGDNRLQAMGTCCRNILLVMCSLPTFRAWEQQNRGRPPPPPQRNMRRAVPSP